jgi:hypothetical protein
MEVRYALLLLLRQSSLVTVQLVATPPAPNRYANAHTPLDSGCSPYAPGSPRHDCCTSSAGAPRVRWPVTTQLKGPCSQGGWKLQSAATTVAGSNACQSHALVMRERRRKHQARWFGKLPIGRAMLLGSGRFEAQLASALQTAPLLRSASGRATR